MISGVGGRRCVVKRRIAVVLTTAGLCGVLAGCISDMGAQGMQQSACNQVQYHGGPKSDVTRTTTNCTKSGKST